MLEVLLNSVNIEKSPEFPFKGFIDTLLSCIITLTKGGFVCEKRVISSNDAFPYTPGNLMFGI